MKLYLIRHAQAEHLLENWKEKVTARQFVKTVKRWDLAMLTPKGIEAAKQKIVPKHGKIFSSPMLRAYQTSELISSAHINVLPALKETFIKPFNFLNAIKFSLNSWMWITVATSLLDFSWIKFVRQNLRLLRIAKKHNSDVIFVAHEARITTILVLARLLFKWKYIKKDTNPLGISVLEYK